MGVLEKLCGEPFIVWSGYHTIGKCFKELCIIIPAFISLLVVSSFFIGYKNVIYLYRSKIELFAIYFRLFIVIFLASIPPYQLYDVYFNEHHSINIIDVIQTVAVSFTWLIHALYLKFLARGITYETRGPVCVNVSIVICFVVTSCNIYIECKYENSRCLNIVDIVVITFQMLYVITFLPLKKLRSEHSAYSVNSFYAENEPLLPPTPCRYNAFHEESDPEALGVAEEHGSILSKIFFAWVKPLMVKGYHKSLCCIEDLYDLPVELQTSHLYEKTLSKVCFQVSDENYQSGSQNTSKSLHLIKELHKCFACEFYSIGILKFLSDCLLFGGPILLNALVSDLEMNDKSTKYGYYYALGLFLTTFFAALCSTHYNYLISRISLKIKAFLIMAVYRKTLLTSKVTLSTMNTGEILNFISTDTDRIVNFCQSFHQFWSLPLQVIIALILLYQQIKYCFFVGLVFMLIVIPINQYIAKKIASYSNFLMKAKDKRIKMMNEIVSGIRIIKMNTWEAIFSRKLKAVRNQEIEFLKKRKYLDALCVYFWATTPVLMSFLTFSLYAALGNQLTASKIFTSIAIFNILIMPLNAFPWVLNGLMEAWISVKRVDVFLQLPNLYFIDYYTETDDEQTKLEIVNGLFAYSSEMGENNPVEKASNKYKVSEVHSYLLGPICLRLTQGDFICILGKVGSGKTSLLSSILAEMNRLSGQVKMNISERDGGIGYVSQEPWIQQKSIKDNILFGKVFNSMKYRNVLEVCALLDDLKTFPFGDNTIVGDKGVTLSGGQKARIALARAVYQDFEIYLLDDPFSAVDAHVAEHIFSNCIMGILKNKSRILCTHKTKYVENADYLIILSDGKIAAQGLPSQVAQLYFVDSNEETDEVNGSKTIKYSEETSFEMQEIQSTTDEEQKEEGVVKFHVYKAYWKSVGSSLAVVVLIFCFLMQASRTVSDWWLSFWISNDQSYSNSSTNILELRLIPEIYETGKVSFKFYLSVYGGLAAVNSIFTLFRAFSFAFAGIKAAMSLHDQLLNNIIKATTSFFDITPLGRIINRFSSDVYCIDDTLPFILNILLAQVFSLVGCIVITCYGLPWIAVLMVILAVIYFRIQRYYRCTSRELKRLSSISLSPIYAHFSETLSGHSTIRALATIERFQKDNMDHLDSNLRAVLATTAASQWLNLRLQFIGVVIVTAVAVIALVQKKYSDVDAGLIGLALSYALSVTSLLNGSITAFTETEKEIVSVERVMQYIKEVKIETSVYLQMPPYGWPSHGVIAFTSVSLKYKPSCPYALRNVTFETRPGEKIGIVGRTGSGKSSLIQVICRMVDSFEGAVFIDGVNVAKLELKKLRSSLSVISQDPFLFCGSVRENLDPSFLRCDAEIWKALRLCHMEEKLHILGGLDVEIQEKGQNFSAGERQLICLARALLQRAKILCMDEATASIDSHTDSLIRHTVRMAFRHSTILIIAHRMETIMDCDRVLVMREGQIMEIDKPSVLLSNSNSEFYGFVYGKIN